MSWFKRKLNDMGSKSGVKDLERVVMMIRGMSDEERSTLFFHSQKALELAHENGFNFVNGLENPDSDEFTDGWCFARQMIKQCQSTDNLELSGAMMVWLHSFRAVHYLECRLYGQQMWDELIRGAEDLHSLGLERIDSFYFPTLLTTARSVEEAPTFLHRAYAAKRDRTPQFVPNFVSDPPCFTSH